MENGASEYFPFMNGSDLPDKGVLVEILKIRSRKKGGFFIDVKADDGNNYTITANDVLTSMLLQLLNGQKHTLYPYKKGENTYISTRKPEVKDSKTTAQKAAGYGRR
jgi:hypothetical protein